jgi:hypothetical protein
MNSPALTNVSWPVRAFWFSLFGVPRTTGWPTPSVKPKCSREESRRGIGNSKTTLRPASFQCVCSLLTSA